nr:OmpW family outer membrane protein [uncultured Cetobacterium sp.]
MKKLLLLSLLVVGGVSYAQTQTGAENLYLRTGVNVYSWTEKFTAESNGESVKVTDGKNDDLGYEFGVEYTHNYNEDLELGLGLLYQRNSKLKEYNAIDDVKAKINGYDSLPVYLTAKYSFKEFDNGVKPYVKGNLGYAFNFNEKDANFKSEGESFSYKLKVDNGLYLAFGGGVEYNNITVDLMYQYSDQKAHLSYNDGEDSGKTGKSGFSNGKVTLGVGYKFNY